MCEKYLNDMQVEKPKRKSLKIYSEERLKPLSATSSHITALAAFSKTNAILAYIYTKELKHPVVCHASWMTTYFIGYKRL